MQKIITPFLVLLYAIYALAIGQTGVAAMNDGTGSFTGTGGSVLVTFNEFNVQGSYTIVTSGFVPAGFQITYGGTLTLMATGTMSQNCGSSGTPVLTLIRQLSGVPTTVATWNAFSQGNVVNIIVVDACSANAQYSIRVGNSGGSSCTVSVSNLVFGFIQGPFPGIYGTSANLVDGNGMTTNTLRIQNYSSAAAEGSMAIGYIGASAYAIATDSPGLSVVWVNGTFYTTCYQSPLKSYGAVRLMRCDGTLIGGAIPTSSGPTPFTIGSNDSVSSDADCYYVEVVTNVFSGYPSCTTSLSNVNFGADQIIVGW
jgi:hypothetical protein